MLGEASVREMSEGGNELLEGAEEGHAKVPIHKTPLIIAAESFYWLRWQTAIRRRDRIC